LRKIFDQGQWWKKGEVSSWQGAFQANAYARLHDGDTALAILVVDDEPEILRLFVRMLSLLNRPLTIFQAMNGQRALQMLRSRKPDLMLLDLVMPEMDGFAVIEKKSQDPAIRDIPVVAVSSLNPRGETNVSHTFSVTRGSGLSARELLSCVQSIAGILVPEDRTAGLKPAEKPGVIPAS